MTVALFGSFLSTFLTVAFFGFFLSTSLTVAFFGFFLSTYLTVALFSFFLSTSLTVGFLNPVGFKVVFMTLKVIKPLPIAASDHKTFTQKSYVFLNKFTFLV